MNPIVTKTIKEIEQAKKTSWENFEKEFLPPKEVLDTNLREFMKLIFYNGFAEGVHFMSIYMAKTMIEESLKLDAENPKSPETPEPKISIPQPDFGRN